MILFLTITSRMHRSSQCYCDVLVLRHYEKGTASKAAAAAKKPVINAGDGVGEHPTQALLDLFTIKSSHSSSGSLRLVLLGDLKHGRTVHSLALLASKLSQPPQITLVSPEQLRMPPSVVAELRQRNVMVEETTDLHGVLPAADVLYVTRVQRERFENVEEYEAVKGAYTINSSLMKKAKPDMVVLHPLPRVDEISTDFDDDPRARYFEQVLAEIRLMIVSLFSQGIRVATVFADGKWNVCSHGTARIGSGCRFDEAVSLRHLGVCPYGSHAVVFETEI